MTFNKSYFDGTCGEYYLGFEPLKVAGGSNPDFIKLITHEVIHGLGFEKRPNDNAKAFVYERFLWAVDEQKIFANLSSSERTSAAKKAENVVFNGRFTREATTAVTILIQLTTAVRLFVSSTKLTV